MHGLCEVDACECNVYCQPERHIHVDLGYRNAEAYGPMTVAMLQRDYVRGSVTNVIDVPGVYGVEILDVFPAPEAPSIHERYTDVVSPVQAREYQAYRVIYRILYDKEGSHGENERGVSKEIGAAGRQEAFPG